MIARYYHVRPFAVSLGTKPALLASSTLIDSNLPVVDALRKAATVKDLNVLIGRYSNMNRLEACSVLRKYSITTSKRHRVNSPDPNAVRILGSQLLAHTGDLSVAQVTGILVSFAGMKQGMSSQLFREIQHKLITSVDDFNPPHLSNSISAIAEMRQGTVPGLLKAVEKRTMDNILITIPRELSVTLRAFARLNWIPSEEFLKGSQSRIKENIHECTPHCLSSTLWALTIFKVRPEDNLLAAVESVMIPNLALFAPFAVVNTINSMRQLQHFPTPDLCKATEDFLLDNSHLLNLEKLAQSVQVLLQCGYRASRLIQKISDRDIKLRREDHDRDL